MSAPLRVLLVTESFPPVCGGSGWSTYELARGLLARGHHVEVVKIEVTPRADAAATDAPPAHDETRYESFRVSIFRKTAPAIPVLRNVVKNERLWAELTTYLERRLARDPVDIVHAQHVLSTVPSIRAATLTSTPVVATVRDYWPVCYWSDLIYDLSGTALCPACTTGMMTKCVKPRAGAAFAAAWPMIPYMRANLKTKRRTLARADAVIAVSSTIAKDLRARAPELADTPLFTIPNPVDLTAIEQATEDAARPMPGPYVLYAGKLAPNKGVQFLLPALERAGIAWPLVIAGDGPERIALEDSAAARGIAMRVLGWLDRREAWAWMRHATLLAFPSYGPESLSRVLIEASALGVPIAAMDTGGTRDIVKPGETGLLSANVDAFSDDLARLAHDERLRLALGHAAREHVRSRFSAASVVERVEHVYRGLVAPEAA